MSLNQNWHAESRLDDFECTIDTPDKIRDGLPDDRETANALSVVYGNLCVLYAEFKERPLFD